MSADTTEQDGSGGHEMRARYLPVSRRELRRRREDELAQQRAAQEESDATSDELAQVSEGEATAESEVELSRAVEDTEAAEAVELPLPPKRADPEVEDSAAEEPGTEERAAEEPGTEERAAEGPEAEVADDESDVEVPAEVPEGELPEPADDDEPARPEEEVADAAAEEAVAAEDSALNDTGTIESDVALSPEEVAALTAEQDAEASENEPEDQPEKTDSEGEAHEEPEPEVTEFIDEQDAPIPASRRAQRLLRDTESLPRLAPELMDELNETTGQIAKHDDPDRVDPELLKKQQALAAKAMQANQARMRQQQAETDREAQRRSQQRPDSEVITGKTVRDARDGDHQEEVFLTGRIDPVHAQGAHGLELDEIIDESSKQAGRQNMLMWLLIVLAVLLLVAVGVVIFGVIL